MAKQALEKDRDAIIAARVPSTLKELIKRFVIKDTHMNESDFLRDAVREKIKREAPDLYKQVFVQGEGQ